MTVLRPVRGPGRRGSVLYVLPSLETGGTERHVSALARDLAARGWRVEVFVLSHKGAVAAELEAAGVPVHAPWLRVFFVRTSRAGRLLRLTASAASLARVLVARRPEIVHFFLPAGYLIGLPLCLLTRRPFRVMSRRGLNRYQQTRPWARRLERLLHRRVTVALGNSRAVVRNLAAEGVPPERLRLIYNGVEADRVRPAQDRARTRAGLGIAADVLVLVIVANLIPYKGHRDLLAALDLARDGLPPGWRLLCVGRDDGIGGGLRAEAARLGLADHVLWLGERRDVADLLAASDIGLLCSHEEGFSNAVLEAMAAGLPMVVTDVGGNAEAVVHGRTGWVVPPRDPPALARALVHLAGDGEARRRFGAAGRRRALTQFAQEGCVAAYEALYEALAAGVRPLPGDTGLAPEGGDAPSDAAAAVAPAREAP